MGNSGTLINDDTLTFTHFFGTSDPFALAPEEKDFMEIVNNTANTMRIDLIRTEIEIIKGSGDYFCWGTQCFLEKPAGSDSIWKSGDLVTTAAGDSAGGDLPLSVYVNPKGFHGTALYKYTFADEDDRSGNSQASIYARWILIDTTDYGKAVVLFDSTKADIDGDTIRLVDFLNNDLTQSDFEHELTFPIFNATDSTLNLDLKREEIQTISGSGDYFSWGAVQSTETQAGTSTSVTAGSPIAVAPRSDAKGSNPFKLFLNPGTVGGTAIYKYSFTDQDDPSKTASIIVKWTVNNVTSLAENILNKGFSIYPNPVEDNTSIRFEEELNFKNQSLEVYNLLGEKVKSIRIDNGANAIDVNTSEMVSGIYFVNVMIDGERIASKKMIVK